MTLCLGVGDSDHAGMGGERSVILSTHRCNATHRSVVLRGALCVLPAGVGLARVVHLHGDLGDYVGSGMGDGPPDGDGGRGGPDGGDAAQPAQVSYVGGIGDEPGLGRGREGDEEKLEIDLSLSAWSYTS